MSVEIVPEVWGHGRIPELLHNCLSTLLHLTFSSISFKISSFFVHVLTEGHQS